jgi:hypothetical protein
MKLKEKQTKEYLSYLDSFKFYMGLSDWRILLSTEAIEQEPIATVESDIYEKTIKIQLSLRFMEQTKPEQLNTLLHELVHGRVLVMKQKIDEFREIEEEHLVNDLVRGFEMVAKNQLGQSR